MAQGAEKQNTQQPDKSCPCGQYGIGAILLGIGQNDFGARKYMGREAYRASVERFAAGVSRYERFFGPKLKMLPALFLFGKNYKNTGNILSFGPKNRSYRETPAANLSTLAR